MGAGRRLELRHAPDLSYAPGPPPAPIARGCLRPEPPIRSGESQPVACLDEGNLLGLASIPGRRVPLGSAVVTAVLFVLMLVLDQADEDSTLGDLADFTWLVFMISVLVLIVVAALTLVGTLRARRAAR